MNIPEKGMARESIMETLRSYKGGDLDWQSGRVMGYIYEAGEKAKDIINEAYTMYLSENALDPTSFPSLLRIENEIVRMIANLLRGDANVVGNFTSGGTESLILAVKTARDYMRFKKPEIKEPEMVLPITAHSSFYKAAHYLCVKPVTIPVLDGTYKTDMAAMRAAINKNTILLVGSAPGYAHGVVDPIEDIAHLAKEHDLDLVVCVAAAQRRGIVDPDEAKRNGKDGDNIAEGFRISGLGQLIEMGIQTDRLVTFGD